MTIWLEVDEDEAMNVLSMLDGIDGWEVVDGRRTSAELRCKFGNCYWSVEGANMSDINDAWLEHARTVHWRLSPRAKAAAREER